MDPPLLVLVSPEGYGVAVARLRNRLYGSRRRPLKEPPVWESPIDWVRKRMTATESVWESPVGARTRMTAAESVGLNPPAAGDGGLAQRAASFLFDPTMVQLGMVAAFRMNQTGVGFPGGGAWRSDSDTSSVVDENHNGSDAKRCLDLDLDGSLILTIAEEIDLDGSL